MDAGVAMKETIVVVHGTWASPTKGVIKWWQPAATENEHAGSFVAKLNAALELRGTTARCWAHCSRQDEAFEWSGDNNWLRRTEAAVNLAGYLSNLRKLGYRYHLVGHSHGGNVIVEALSNFSEHESNLGKIVTIATPFLDTSSPIAQRRRRNQRFIQFGSYAAALALLCSMIFSIASEAADPLPMLGLLLFAPLAWGVWFWRRRRQRSAMSLKPDRAAGGLAITSRMDEVWQVLHHLRSSEDPIAVRKNILVDVWDGIRTNYQQRKLVSRLHGATEFSEVSLPLRLAIGFAYTCILATPILAYFVLLSVHAMLNKLGEKFNWTDRMPLDPGVGEVTTFAVLFSVGFLFFVMAATAFLGTAFYSAFLAPLRFLARASVSLVSVPQTIVTRIAPNRLWTMLQKFAMGLNGYAFELPHISTEPVVDCPIQFSVEELAVDIEKRAVEQRGNWVQKKIGGATTAFSAVVLTPSEIENLLKALSEDLTLVHAAYYTDDKCINRIADWISGVTTRVEC